MKISRGTINDVNNILTLAYDLNKDLGKEFVEKAIVDWCVYLIKDEGKIVGCIIYSDDEQDIQVKTLLVQHDNYIGVMLRLFHIIDGNTPYSVEMIVDENDTDIQIALRDHIGMKCIDYSDKKLTFSKIVRKRNILDSPLVKRN